MKKEIVKRAGKVIYRNGDKLVKLFDSEYSKSNILNEALNQARVEECGLSIPKIHEVTKIDGKWAIVMDFIEGETLAEKMEKDPQNIDKYLEQFVEIQLDMHRHTVPLLNKLKDKMNRKIDEANIDASSKYELHTRLSGMPSHRKLCHGDFNPSNIIIGVDGNAYIIDWSHATQGNASADVARTYLLFMLEGKEETAKKYLKLFCEKSETAYQYVQSWLPIVAASQSVKGKIEERKFLLKWVNVVEWE